MLYSRQGPGYTRVIDLFRFARRRLDEEHLTQVAGSLTFTTVLSLVPVLTVAFAVFTTFPLFDTFRSSLEAYFIKSLMPKSVAGMILGYLNQFAAKASRLSAVGAVGLIVTTIATLDTIDRTFNDIWGVRSRRPIMRSIVVYWAIVTLGALLIGASMTLTSYLAAATTGIVAGMQVVGTLLYTLVSIVFTGIAFTLLYTVVPNRHVDWRDAAWGALVAAVAFEIAKRLFAIFIARFPTYTMVYGAVAVVPIFLVWIYLSWLITLIGAVIASALPVVKYERWWHVATPMTAFADAMSALRILHAARTDGASAAVDSFVLRERTGLGFDELDTLLQKMLEAGWLGRVKSDSRRHVRHGNRDSWMLLANPAILTLADVYRLFMFSDASDAALSAKVGHVIESGLPQSLDDYFRHDGNVTAGA